MGWLLPGSGVMGIGLLRHVRLVPPAQVASEPGVVDLADAVGNKAGQHAAPRSRLKRVIGDGKGRAVSAAMVVRSPSPQQAPASSALVGSPVQQGRTPFALSSPRSLQAQAAMTAETGAGSSGKSRPKSKSKAEAKAKGKLSDA